MSEFSRVATGIVVPVLYRELGISKRNSLQVAAQLLWDEHSDDGPDERSKQCVGLALLSEIAADTTQQILSPTESPDRSKDIQRARLH